MRAQLRKVQSQDAFHDQQRLRRDMFAAVYTQVSRKVVDRSLNGLARSIVLNLAFQEPYVNGIRRVVVLLGSLLQRKMVHLNRVDFHRDNVSIETCGHTLGPCRFAAARRASETDDKDFFLHLPYPWRWRRRRAPDLCAQAHYASTPLAVSPSVSHGAKAKTEQSGSQRVIAGLARSATSRRTVTRRDTY